MSITKRVFGRNAQGETVTQYILTNAMGAAIKVIDFGAILTSVTVPDRNGKLADVVTGFDDMEGYLKPHGSMGETIGRYGNRIAKGRVTIGHQQRREPSARRQGWFRCKDVAGDGASRRGQGQREAAFGEPGRGGELSRHADGGCDLHVDGSL